MDSAGTLQGVLAKFYRAFVGPSSKGPRGARKLFHEVEAKRQTSKHFALVSWHPCTALLCPRVRKHAHSWTVRSYCLSGATMLHLRRGVDPGPSNVEQPPLRLAAAGAAGRQSAPFGSAGPSSAAPAFDSWTATVFSPYSKKTILY